MPRRPHNDGDSLHGRAATIRDVASRAGVSVATVSRVLTGNYPVAAATRAKVLRAVRDLDYVVNAHARALAGTRSKTIAVLLSNLTSPFYNRVASGVEQQAMAEDRLCMVSTTGGDPEREVKLVETLREQNVDAVVLVGGVVDTPEYREHMARLARLLDSAGSRLVVCGRPSPGENLPVTVVEYDNAGGAFAAAGHLLSQGHRRILFIGGDPANTTTRDRLDGYRRATAAYGIEEDPGLIIVGGQLPPFAYAALKERLAAGPPDFTAVFAWDDHMAARALVALREAKVSVPADVSVIGYNDEREAQDVYPALTTVSIPHTELGREAVRLALHRNEPAAPSQHVMLGTHIVLRDSVRPLINR
ncbi:LacI family DNA-binding transcriptional regulator [Catenulispora sp. NF23]|uniref:LacI family DNA-binding transcriptional regulator n=1 Tax=Catenulispora pinistramenti TaxID=2705254 RepID=A0ABS5KGY9_9ACTN|nr:LacI family DNA-binding transcriptional regulator [Catenulispora pinistramenti]MBS2532387.1 LacI family DNA-binding transcriptional regulator [Catenulispora pinistramenti]MBS2545582.1 LacI family DNA-binding transcriptional regulator [Catenulispora pinistramenti]